MASTPNRALAQRPEDAADRATLTRRESKQYANGIELMKFDRVR